MSVKVNGQAQTVTASDAGIVDCVVEIAPPHTGNGIWNRAA